MENLITFSSETRIESFRSKRGVDESLRLHVHRVKKRRGDTDR